MAVHGADCSAGCNGAVLGASQAQEKSIALILGFAQFADPFHFRCLPQEQQIFFC